jgi:hypothetical protein
MLVTSAASPHFSSSRFGTVCLIPGSMDCSPMALGKRCATGEDQAGQERCLTLVCFLASLRLLENRIQNQLS